MKTTGLYILGDGTCNNYSDNYHQWLVAHGDCFCSNWYYTLTDGEFMFGVQYYSTIVYCFDEE